MVGMVASIIINIITDVSDQLCWSGHSKICRCKTTSWLKNLVLDAKRLIYKKENKKEEKE